MPALAELQGLMRSGLLTTDLGFEAELLGAVAPCRGASAEARLRVYRNNVSTALVQALRLTYPTVEWLVGAPFFEVCALDFLRNCPPTAAYLGGWGETLEDALRSDPRLAGLPYLPEAARLDYALDGAFHAADTPRIGALDLARLDPDRYDAVALVAHPSVRLLNVSYPVREIRQARVDEDAERLASLDMTPRPHALLVERHAIDGVCLRVLDPHEAALTSVLLAGASVGDALELATSLLAGFDPMPLIVEHVTRGRIAAVRPVDAAPLPADQHNLN